MPKSAFGVDLAMNCATTNAYILKLTHSVRFPNRTEYKNLIYQTHVIVETKIWRGDNRYQAGKRQLAVYLNTEGVTEGYYIVFDHRENPEPRGRDRND